MAWSITRKATDEDIALLKKRAKAFATRHNLEAQWCYTGDAIDLELTLEAMIEYGNEVEQLEGKRLLRLWKRIANRAIGDDGIDLGNVGHTIE